MKKKRIVKLSKTIWLILIVVTISIVVFGFFQDNIYVLLASFGLLVFAQFFLLQYVDLCNDVNRINMWIFLKRKLGE